MFEKIGEKILLVALTGALALLNQKHTDKKIEQSVQKSIDNLTDESEEE